jgi:ubiquinone/menaquinone biosynthesis C-methylase UbiE
MAPRVSARAFAMRRVIRPELLDSDQASEREVKTSLADLQRINRWFGGYHTTRQLIRRALSRTHETDLALLDVGSATGDGPRKVGDAFANRSLKFTLLDRDPAHFNGASSPMSRVAGDALALPFADNSFDFVVCSLFAHHLEPDELRRFADEALRVCRIALLINDLRRSYVHLGLAYLGKPLFRSRLTRHDTVASVQRAYTVQEMEDILKRSRASCVEIYTTFLCRMGAIAWK